VAEGEVLLRSGPLTALLTQGDLFDVRWHGIEVVQRMYVAVRDVNWSTIPAHLSPPEIEVGDEATTAEFTAHHRYGEIDFRWRAHIVLARSGELTYRMTGQTAAAFQYCKIGFNIHHGLRVHAGRPFRCFTEAGIHADAFDADLQPQLVRNGTLTAMTPHFDRLEIDLADVDLAFEFSGDRFEMQDHRNWVDANWKTYSTPLERGFPLTAAAGSDITQEVRLHLQPPRASHPPAETVELQWPDAPAGILPTIGHSLREIPSASELTILRTLAPQHLRVDVRTAGDPAARLTEAEQAAHDLGCAMEIALYIRPDDLAAELAQLIPLVTPRAGAIARLLVFADSSGFSPFRGACPADVAVAVKAALAEGGAGGTPVFSGTTQFFVDINRDRPDYSALDGIVFAVNPQVHASDDRSMMQSPQALVDIAAFIGRIYDGLAVSLSPVDLIGVDGPYPAGPERSDGSPPNVDPRLWTDFAAAWTVAAVAAMTQAGINSVTLFDLTGSRGLLASDGNLSPVGTLLAALAPLAARPSTAVVSSDPDRCCALAFTGAPVTTIVVANLTGVPCPVSLPDGTGITLPPYGIRWSDITSDAPGAHNDAAGSSLGGASGS